MISLRAFLLLIIFWRQSGDLSRFQAMFAAALITPLPINGHFFRVWRGIQSKIYKKFTVQRIRLLSAWVIGTERFRGYSATKIQAKDCNGAIIFRNVSPLIISWRAKGDLSRFLEHFQKIL